MPTILLLLGWRIFFYANEGNEPALSTVVRARKSANTGLIAKISILKKPTPTSGRPPHEWWGLDRTKVLVQGVGWVYMVVVLDWYTKAIAGHYAGVRGTAPHWLLALDMAVHRQFPEGA